VFVYSLSCERAPFNARPFITSLRGPRMTPVRCALIALIALVALGCGTSHIYRAKNPTDTCQAVLSTDCSGPPPDPNRIRLCGNAFVTMSDFQLAAQRYCPKPKLRNCVLQCCDVDCGPAPAPGPTPAATTPPAVAAPAPSPPPPPPGPSTAQPATSLPPSDPNALPPAPPPPPPPPPAATPPSAP
jgi:hypothetical protein